MAMLYSTWRCSRGLTRSSSTQLAKSKISSTDRKERSVRPSESSSTDSERSTWPFFSTVTTLVWYLLMRTLALSSPQYTVMMISKIRGESASFTSMGILSRYS